MSRQRSLRPLAYTTVMTVLDRLARRGCVDRRKVGRGFIYSAVLSRDSVRRVAIEDLIHCYFDGSEESLRHYFQAAFRYRLTELELT